MTQCFKILLVGDYGVGKTAFAQCIIGNEWKKLYFRSRRNNVLAVTNGEVIFEIWEYPTDIWKYPTESLIVLGDADALILMFSFDSKASCEHLEHWLEQTRRVTGEIRTIVCGNKADTPERAIEPQSVTFPGLHGFKYFEVSAKTTLNCEKPFAFLEQVL